MLGSAVTRDAERVTAREIDKDIQELEMAFGGIYSRFTHEWQQPVANMLLAKQKITVRKETIYPVIITGMDTLSRFGQVQNFQTFIQVLAMTAQIPEKQQEKIDDTRLMAWVGNNTNVPYMEFVKTPEQLQQEVAAQQQQVQQMQAAQTGHQMMQDANKELVKGEE